MSKAISLMKNAQTQKTKLSIDRLVQWYSKKQQFFKTYFPIQQAIIKKLFQSSQISCQRLKQITNIISDQKQLQAIIYQKCQKNTLKQDTKFQPKTIQKIDPNDPKGQNKLKIQLPSWCSNIDRVLLSMSKNQKQKQSKIKQIYKTLDSIQQIVSKQQSKYKNEINKFQKQLQKWFNRLDDSEKQQSKIVGKIIKQSKNNDIKDSSFFIGQFKKIQKQISYEFKSFFERNKIIIQLIKEIIKNQKLVAKKIKQQLTIFFTFKKQVLGIQSMGQQQIMGYLSISQDKVEAERLKYFNATLLNQENIVKLKKIINLGEIQSNWQTIIGFIQLSHQKLMNIIKTKQILSQILKTISYRCWEGISIAQGWLIQTYQPSIMYMTYDYIMLIYNIEGNLLKKIHTNSSKINRIEGSVVFLQQKINGFFTDSLQQYKIKFEDSERLEQFQLFIQNQIK